MAVHYWSVVYLSSYKTLFLDWSWDDPKLKAMFRIRIHLIRIRVQHCRLNTDPDPGFWSPIWSKIAIYLSIGFDKGRPSYRKSLQNSKHFKTWNFFFFLWVIFALLDPDLIVSGSNSDPDQEHWLNVQYFDRIDKCVPMRSLMAGRCLALMARKSGVFTPLTSRASESLSSSCKGFFQLCEFLFEYISTLSGSHPAFFLPIATTSNKNFWKWRNCKWEMQMLWIRGQGAIKRGLLCSLSAFPSFIKPGTRQTGLTGRFQKSFDMNNWHLLRKGEKL